jgi:hypothetical protein
MKFSNFKAAMGDVLGFHNGQALYVLAQVEPYMYNLISLRRDTVGNRKTSPWKWVGSHQAVSIPQGTMVYGGPPVNYGQGAEGVRKALGILEAAQVMKNIGMVPKGRKVGRVMNTSELAYLKGKSPRTVRRYAQYGQVPTLYKDTAKGWQFAGREVWFKS